MKNKNTAYFILISQSRGAKKNDLRKTKLCGLAPLQE
jgi:uncharacterized membrane protein